MSWYIKYRNGENTLEEVIKKSQEMNKNQGKEIIKDNYVYWLKDFPEFKKNYLRDYPKSKELFEYRVELENNETQIISNNSLQVTKPSTSRINISDIEYSFIRNANSDDSSDDLETITRKRIKKNKEKHRKGILVEDNIIDCEKFDINGHSLKHCKLGCRPMLEEDLKKYENDIEGFISRYINKKDPFQIESSSSSSSSSNKRKNIEIELSDNDTDSGDSDYTRNQKKQKKNKKNS
jgi:hypothetical protein